MTPEQIREIVKLTIDELADRKQLKELSYQEVLPVVNKKLYGYFDKKGDTANIGYLLNQLSDDTYIDILYLHYRDRKPLERIAEYMEKDISTIKRNKKRLIMKIYKKLEL